MDDWNGVCGCWMVYDKVVVEELEVDLVEKIEIQKEKTRK